MALSAEAAILLVKIPLVYTLFYFINKPVTHRFTTFFKVSGLVLSLALAVIFHRLLISKYLLDQVYFDNDPKDYLIDLPHLISSFLDLIFIAGVAVALNQYRRYQRWKEREKALVKEKLQAELMFLRNQTNPHFLFNTLNNIYALARKKSDDTADVVMKLSKLLRFMLYESRRDTISIAEELRVLGDYIELEKIRYNDRLLISFNKSIDNGQQAIAPLILLPFVENAFKHGASETRFESYINIDIEIKNNQLQFTIVNSKEEDSTGDIQENIGLSNIRRQLELMYPGHRLVLENGKQEFKVSLNLNLSSYAAVSMYYR